MTLDQFGKYYGICARVAEEHRIPCHELRWLVRRQADILMYQEEVEEIAYKTAAQLCQERGYPVPRRHNISHRRRELAKLSTEAGRKIEIFEINE